jgi:type III restriction enzyme
MKLPERKTELYIEYIASDSTIRPYFPDFIAKTNRNEIYIIETKGLEDIEVKRKDERARLWCEDMSKLTKTKWEHIRIDQKFFEAHEFSSIYELLEAQRNFRS